MRVVVHDYVGHPFQVQLSRALAGRGHQVLHLHCPSYTSGKGALERTAADPESLRIDAVTLNDEFAKHSPVRRVRQEWVYGNRAAARVERFRPDVVLSSNTPLVSQLLLLRAARSAGAAFVFWQQDVISAAIERYVAARLPRFLGVLAKPFVLLERSLLRRSDAVVPISEDFEPILRRWGVPADRIHVVHNWAPVDELPLAERANEFAHDHDLGGKTVFLYSGTLGLKHDPEHLVSLGRRFTSASDVAVVVVSQGVGADHVARGAAAEGLANVRVLPYQPYERLPDVFGAADVLLALLEPDAGVYSVPSKILSYHCAGRPILAAIPASNLAARLIREVGSGIVVEPHDYEAFDAAAALLYEDAVQRREMGGRARAYAEWAFDIGRIADAFEGVFESARRKAAQDEASVARTAAAPDG